MKLAGRARVPFPLELTTVQVIMIVTLPTTKQPNDQIALGGMNAILHDTSRRYYWQGTGSLSIKAFFGGQALYNNGQGYYAVGDDTYLVLNNGQAYAINIEAAQPIESFCLFFEPGFEEQVYASLTNTPETLLDGPTLLPINFYEKTYQHDDWLLPDLLQLKSQLAPRRHDRVWLEERLHRIMQRLLQVHFQAYRQVEQLPGIRATTRDELYRRLHLARDYAHALYATPLTLDQLAGVACLAPNYFLRMFRSVFGQTPHQYLTTVRLEHACRLLRETETPITEICYMVGYASPGSFSTLFRQHRGMSPRQYRIQNAAKR